MPNIEQAAAFRALHRADRPLILFNAWDAGSALTVAKAGALAIATGSWSIAAANGEADGEKIRREIHLETIRRISAVTDLPLTADLESGFSTDPEGVGETVRLSIEAGAIGCNLEDSFPADGSMRDREEAAERIRAARRSADAHCPGFFLNARTDVFSQAPADKHDHRMVEDVIARANAYAEAGADGIFVPFTADLEIIARIAEAVPIPLNVMRIGAEPATSELAAAGVARISHGPWPYMVAMKALEEAAKEANCRQK